MGVDSCFLAPNARGPAQHGLQDPKESWARLGWTHSGPNITLTQHDPVSPELCLAACLYLGGRCRYRLLGDCLRREATQVCHGAKAERLKLHSPLIATASQYGLSTGLNAKNEVHVYTRILCPWKVKKNGHEVDSWENLEKKIGKVQFFQSSKIDKWTAGEAMALPNCRCFVNATNLWLHLFQRCLIDQISPWDLQVIKCLEVYTARFAWGLGLLSKIRSAKAIWHDRDISRYVKIFQSPKNQKVVKTNIFETISELAEFQ